MKDLSSFIGWGKGKGKGVWGITWFPGGSEGEGEGEGEGDSKEYHTALCKFHRDTDDIL